MQDTISGIDLFCGAGGLTHGLLLEGLQVIAGIDNDEDCRYPYEANNSPAKFIESDIKNIPSAEISTILKDAQHTFIAGCAPCQPFSTYSRRYTDAIHADKWFLLTEFERIVQDCSPTIVAMENVPSLIKHDVFSNFQNKLQDTGYHVWHEIVNCIEYGVPQKRKRIVLLASKLGQISLDKIMDNESLTVRHSISQLPILEAGCQSLEDPLHISAGLSPINLERIKQSTQGGTWRDWPKDLIVRCHMEHTGRSYGSVYGRMEWDKPAPTITTQCFGFGNGRFGHPEQNRALSLREAALLQSFPITYKFVRNRETVNMSTIGRLIGNAVPVNLGRAIGRSIKQHLKEHSLT